MKFQTPRGTRDFLPEEMRKRQYVLDKIRDVFERWGFDPIETPAFEEWSLLSAKQGGGEEIKNEIYFFKDKNDREMGLRFDLTVPLSRIILNNPALTKPFRRYSIGRVWRYDRPGTGRYREFWQADVDIVGSSGNEADATVIAVACSALRELGFNDFFVRINNRKILESFLASIDVDNYTDVFRAIDKLDKIGPGGVERELKQRGIKNEKIGQIMDFINGTKKKYDGLEDLEKIKEFLSVFGFKNVKIDFSMIRGLDYYTGPVFEIGYGKYGLSIGGGGRYDNLIASYGGPKTPMTGISLGVERIMEIMEREGMTDLPKTNTQVFIANVNDAVKKDAIKIAERLISSGICTEFDVAGKNLKKQMEYVNSRGIPFSIVVGEKELKSGKAVARNMKTGKETEVKLSDMEKIKLILEK